MITILEHLRKDAIEIDDCRNLEEAASWIRDHWHEDDDKAQLVSLVDEAGIIQATMFTGVSPDHCVTAYRDGRTVVHLCRYLYSDTGEFTGSEVKKCKNTV
jgi:hypothetical protein